LSACLIRLIKSGRLIKTGAIVNAAASVDNRFRQRARRRPLRGMDQSAAYNNSVVWFRRDLRCLDCLSLFDREILDALPRADDRQVKDARHF
jgi:hypothetical protein